MSSRHSWLALDSRLMLVGKPVQSSAPKVSMFLQPAHSWHRFHFHVRSCIWEPLSPSITYCSRPAVKRKLTTLVPLRAFTWRRISLSRNQDPLVSVARLFHMLPRVRCSWRSPTIIFVGNVKHDTTDTRVSGAWERSWLRGPTGILEPIHCSFRIGFTSRETRDYLLSAYNLLLPSIMHLLH